MSLFPIRWICPQFQIPSLLIYRFNNFDSAIHSNRALYLPLNFSEDNLQQPFPRSRNRG